MTDRLRSSRNRGTVRQDSRIVGARRLNVTASPLRECQEYGDAIKALSTLMRTSLSRGNPKGDRVPVIPV
jgi:hypothetical protein